MLSQNGESDYGGGNPGECYAERVKTTTNDAADDKVRRNAASTHEKSAGADGGIATGGRTAESNACEYTAASVDNSRRGSQGGIDIASDSNGIIGRNHKDEDRQRNKEKRSHRLWKEGMDIDRHDEHHKGYNLPEGTHRTKCQTVSRGGANLLRSRTNVPDQIGRTKDKTKGKKRDDGEGDGM